MPLGRSNPIGRRDRWDSRQPGGTGGLLKNKPIRKAMSRKLKSTFLGILSTLAAGALSAYLDIPSEVAIAMICGILAKCGLHQQAQSRVDVEAERTKQAVAAAESDIPRALPVDAERFFAEDDTEIITN